MLTLIQKERVPMKARALCMSVAGRFKGLGVLP
jgi:hypothetical protein